MRLAGGTPSESALTYALAGALATGGPVWHYLHVNGYAALRPEAVVLPLAGALAGACVALAARRAGGVIGSLIFGGLLLAFLDLQLAPEHWTYMALVGLGCVALAMLLQARRAAITAITLGAFYAAAIPQSDVVRAPRPTATPGSARSSNPVLLHVLLDEQWGIGGLRAAGDTATADFLSDFYVTRGFEVHEAAYSRLQFSMESIPEVVSMGAAPRFNPPAASTPYWRSMARIPYFERLAALGYEVHVYQSTYLDFCRAAGAPVVSCHVASGNSIANIAHLEGPWTRRALLASRFFLDINSRIWARLHPDSEVWRRSITGGAFAAARELRQSIARGPAPGTAYFVHLLLPHRPIDVDASCEMLRDPAWRLYDDYFRPAGDSAWREALATVGGQVRCAHRVLDGILATLDSAVGRDRSIVLVHGDHGGRLIHGAPHAGGLASLEASELNAIFPTLLAIRRPGVPAARYEPPVPMQDFVHALAANGFVGEPAKTWSHYLRKWPDPEASADTLRVLRVEEMPWVRASR